MTNGYHLQRAHLNNNYNGKSLCLLGLYVSAKTSKLTNKLNNIDLVPDSTEFLAS